MDLPVIFVTPSLEDLAWDAVRDPNRIKVIKPSDRHDLYVQFDPEDTLVFPVNDLSPNRRQRLQEARPDLFPSPIRPAESD